MAVPVTVVATIRAKPGREAETRAVLEGLLAKTRVEAGCLNYDLHVAADDPGTFLFHENWESKAHLDRHLESEHLTAFKARFDELLREHPAIDLYERIG
ncbi:MAG: putative quinol monooxygenase [Planctomycetota bacterium JB042]